MFALLPLICYGLLVVAIWLALPIGGLRVGLLLGACVLCVVVSFL